jgi:glycosyltransferase involved in cell wall biosynthesis
MNYKNKADMRILIVVSELKAGGMERVVVNLAKGLSSEGIPVMVVCIKSLGDLAGELKNENIKVETLNSYKSKDIKSLFFLGRIIKKFRPSLISIHDYSSLPYAAAASFVFKKTPLVFTGHGLLYEGFENLKKRHRFFSKALSGFSAVSEKVAQRHRDYLNYPGEIRVIKNGVFQPDKDFKKRDILRKELKVDDDQFLFLAVGNPRPEKGFEDLADACAILKKMHEKTGKKFKVVIAGRLDENNYCTMIKNRIKEKNIEKVFILVGFRSDTPDLYSAADGFVLSSRSEGMPMVILEAMTSGLPVAATKVGGVPDTVKDTAVLAEPADPYSLAEAMNSIMDKKTSEILGHRAKEIAKREYSLEKMVEKYLDFFSGIIKSKEK